MVEKNKAEIAKDKQKGSRKTIKMASLLVVLALLVFTIITFAKVVLLGNDVERLARSRPVFSELSEDGKGFLGGKIVVVEEDSEDKSSYSTYVVGVLKNETGKTISRAVLYIKGFDDEGKQISGSSETITNWKDGDSWSYRVFKSSLIDKYEISVLEVTL